MRGLVKHLAKIQEQHLTLTTACAKLKLIGSHNSHANENHVVNLIRLENGSDDNMLAMYIAIHSYAAIKI